MFKQTHRLLIVRPRVPKLATVFLVVVLSALGAMLFAPVHPAAAATSSTINFQARLENAAGAIVPDGYYNVEFKLYSASTGGTAEWTEDYTYNSGSGQCSGPNGTSDCRVRVTDGYLTVNLGSITAFPGTISWDQQQWLTMNIGGTSGTSTTWDGEMSPRLQLTAVPYAFRSSTLVGGSGSNVTTLTAGTPSGTNAITLPAASGTVCLQGSTSCNFAPASGGSGYVQLQSSIPGSPQGTSSTGNFNIAGTGIVGTELQAPLIDSSGTLNIGTSTATGVTLGNTSINTNITGSNVFITGNTSISANDTFSVVSGAAAITGFNSANSTPTLRIDSHSSGASPLVVQSGGTTVFTIANGGSATLNPTNSTTAFQVQNSAGTTIL